MNGFLSQAKMDAEIDYRRRIQKTAGDDKMFFMVALNLTGKRDKLEEKAAKIINKNGYLKALKISKAKGKRHA